MGSTYKILIAVLLLTLSGVGAAFFIKNQARKKEEQTNTSATEPIIENTKSLAPVNSDSVMEQPNIEETIKFDIAVSEVDTQNRRFSYDMHYQGIKHSGTFEDGITGIVQVDKGFGSFLIVQAIQAETPSVSTKGAAQKVRGGVTGGTTATKNDSVSLSIIDNKGQQLKNVVVNLSTGTIKTSNLNNLTNLRTI
jgi:hypothetical protein